MTPRFRSLLWKLVLPVPIAAAIGLLVAWVFLPEQIRENARANATESATDIVSQYKTIRGYYTRNVIKKVVADGNLFPTYDHKEDPGAVPLPATFVHDVSELLSKENTSIKLYSAHPFPNRADRKLDDFQQAAWDFLNQNPDDRFTRLEMSDGAPVMRVAIADKMVAQACVDCHNGRPDTPKADWKLGDVRGVLEVATGIGPALARGEALSNTVMIAVALFSLALAGITVLSARSVSNPIKGMTSALDRLAAGDTGTEIPYQDKSDEIGAMAKSAEVFKENALAREKLESERAETHEAERKSREERRFQLANEFEDRVGTVTASVLSAANQLRSSANSLARGTESVAEHASNVSTAAEQSTEAVTAVSGTTGDLNQSISEIATQVHKSTDMAVAAVKAIEETNTKVQGLVDAAEEIGNVVALINDIAEQTNLLALNATIEAARAGEAGKGFAVVASEVKNLAGQTGKATNEIESQMGDIQAATKDAVTAIESIAKIISELDGVSAAVSAAVEEQSASVKTIAESTGHASDGANQVMSGITGVTSTAENTHAQAQEMLEAASSLSSDVEGLQQQVSKFVETIRGS